MDKRSPSLTGWLFGSLFRYIRRFLFRVLSMGVIPQHIALILDGNRRYAKKMKIPEVVVYRVAYLTLICMLKYCHELGVKYVSIYAFSIDNFRRRPDEVQFLMDLLLHKLEGLQKYKKVLDQYGVRVHFVGNLKLLDKQLRAAVGNTMEATKMNSNITVIVCVAYTSTDEIVHAAQACCRERRKKMKAMEGNGDCGAQRAKQGVVTVEDLGRHMYLGLAPDVDIVVRTSGETRLSNFLLWQSSRCLLYSPKVLFPEIGLRQLVLAVLNYQRAHHYLHTTKMVE